MSTRSKTGAQVPPLCTRQPGRAISARFHGQALGPHDRLIGTLEYLRRLNANVLLRELLASCQVVCETPEPGVYRYEIVTPDPDLVPAARRACLGLGLTVDTSFPIVPPSEAEPAAPGQVIPLPGRHPSQNQFGWSPGAGRERPARSCAREPNDADQGIDLSAIPDLRPVPADCRDQIAASLRAYGIAYIDGQGTLVRPGEETPDVR